MGENPDELAALLARVNRRRAAGESSAAAERDERDVESRFGASRRLAAYGTLQPGLANHGVVAELAGTWRRGWVRGHLVRQGWGVYLGFPALRWDPQGEEIPVSVLTSDDLPPAWERIDRFEGPAYLRILVPVRSEERERIEVANLYAGRGKPASALRVNPRGRRSPGRDRRP